jgi:peptidase E
MYAHLNKKISLIALSYVNTPTRYYVFWILRDKVEDMSVIIIAGGHTYQLIELLSQNSINHVIALYGKLG